jgi:hypothetical protein
MLNYTYFPHKWKKAKVIAILKKDRKNSDPNSYRPICLLPNISKVYERIINDVIVAYCQDKNIIPENQYRFKKNHSTVHAINKLSSDINWALNDRKCVGACLIDLEKAFDTVWLDSLIVKLKCKKFPMLLIKLVWNLIYQRSFNTFSNEFLSTISFTLQNGLQQDTINSPILFNMTSASGAIVG